MAGEEINGGTVVYQFVGDTAELEAALARLQAQFEETEQAAEGAGGGVEFLADDIDDSAKSAAIGGREFRNLGAAVALIGPTTSKVVRVLKGFRAGTIAAKGAMAATGTAATALIAPLAAVGAGLASVGLAYKLFADDVREAEQAQRRAASAAQAMFQAAAPFKALQESINREYQVFSGEISKADQQIGDFTATINAQVLALKEQAFARQGTTIATIQGIEAEGRALIAQFTEMRRAEQAERDLIATKAERAAAAQIAAAAERELAAAVMEEAAAEAERLRLMEEARRKRVIAVNDALDEVAARQDLKEQKDEEDTAKAIARAQLVQRTVEDSAISVSGSIADAAADAAQRQADAGKKSARIMFGISKTAALAQVAFNAAVAISRQFADLPFPAAIASSAAIGASAVAPALAAIKSQAPPAEHIGTGMIGGGDPLAPDERISARGRRVLQGEMQTSAGTANTTGSQMLNDLNTGRFPGGSGGQVIRAVIGRSHLDGELDRSGRGGTTRYSRQLRTNPHPKPNRGY